MATRATKTDVINLALSHLGDLRVSSDTEDCVEIDAVNAHFNNERRTLIRDFDWNFATTETDLAEVEDAGLFGYDRAFQLPDDYLKVIKFNYVEGGTKQCRWKLAQQLIHTDDTTAKLEYVFDETDCTKWDDTFVKAFGWFLAAAIAPQLSKSQNLNQAHFQAAVAFLHDAKGHDTQESGLKVINGINSSPYLRARQGWGGVSLDAILANDLTLP